MAPKKTSKPKAQGNPDSKSSNAKKGNKQKSPTRKHPNVSGSKQHPKRLENEPTRLIEEKQNVFNIIEQEQNALKDIGHDIWRYAETGGNEVKSHKRIVNYLQGRGFKVSELAEGFSTGFRAEFGSGVPGSKRHPNIGFVCEYNADPVTGHSHGHNLNTVNCLAAAIGLQNVIMLSKKPLGKVTVVGCPANETKTAKKEIQETVGFAHIDFLIMAYPAPFTCLQPRFVASNKVKFTFQGRSLKDGVQPWEMANPVNGVVLTQQNVAALRQTFSHEWSLNGVIVNAGHDPSQQPDKATCVYEMKAPTQLGLRALDTKLHQCVDGAAMASGCKVEETSIGMPMVANINCPKLVNAYRRNAELNGFTFHNDQKDMMQDPDDIAFVSRHIATFKLFYYAGTSAKRGTDEFNGYCGSTEAEYMSIVQGKSLAMLAVDICLDKDLMTEIMMDFSEEAKECKRKHSDDATP